MAISPMRERTARNWRVGSSGFANGGGGSRIPAQCMNAYVANTGTYDFGSGSKDGVIGRRPELLAHHFTLAGLPQQGIDLLTASWRSSRQELQLSTSRRDPPARCPISRARCQGSAASWRPARFRCRISAGRVARRQRSPSPRSTGRSHENLVRGLSFASVIKFAGGDFRTVRLPSSVPWRRVGRQTRPDLTDILDQRNGDYCIA